MDNNLFKFVVNNPDIKVHKINVYDENILNNIKSHIILHYIDSTIFDNNIILTIDNRQYKFRKNNFKYK